MKITSQSQKIYLLGVCVAVLVSMVNAVCYKLHSPTTTPTVAIHCANNSQTADIKLANVECLLTFVCNSLDLSFFLLGLFLAGRGIVYSIRRKTKNLRDICLGLTMILVGLSEPLWTVPAIVVSAIRPAKDANLFQ